VRDEQSVAKRRVESTASMREAPRRTDVMWNTIQPRVNVATLPVINFSMCGRRLCVCVLSSRVMIRNCARRTVGMYVLRNR